MKKLISVVLALAMILSLAAGVFAYEAPAGINSLAIVGSNIPNVVSWDPSDPAGDMELVADYVYEKEVTLTAGTQMTFKVAGNDKWDDSCNFGTASKQTLTLGTVTEMVCHGGSGDMTVVADKDMTVKITVDLTAFVNGGAATILVEEVVEETTYVLENGVGQSITLEPGQTAKIQIDATNANFDLLCSGNYQYWDWHVDNGMQWFYPNPMSVYNMVLTAGSVYTLTLVCDSADTAQTVYVRADMQVPGTYDNPDELVMGENIAEVPAYNAYYYTWTATEDGTLTLAIDNSKYTDWTICANGERADGTYYYGDTYFSSDAASANVEINVKTGDVFTIVVGTDSYDAGTVGVEASFVAGSTGGESGGETGGESGGETGGETEGDAMVSVTDEAVTATAPWTYTFTAESTGVLNVKVSSNVAFKIYGLTGPDSESLRLTANSWSAGTDSNHNVTVPGEITVKVWCWGGSAAGEIDGNISCTLTFTPDEIEIPKEVYIVSGTDLAIGENDLTMEENAENTLFEFEPTEIGTYTFTAPEGVLIGNWNTSTFPLDTTVNKTNTVEWTCTGVGQSILIGVVGSEDTVLTVTKTADGEEQEQIEYVDYENVHIPSDDNLVDTTDEQVNNVDITKPQTVVKDENGFYHLGSVEGPMIYVDLVTDIRLPDAFYSDYGALTMRGEYEGTKYDFLGAMYDYASTVYGSDNGLYPLTDDLVAFLKGYGSYQGWYMANLSPFESIDGTENAESAWLASCVYLGEEIVDENPGEDDPSEENPGSGDYSVAGLVVAMMAATAGAIVISKKKEF